MSMLLKSKFSQGGYSPLTRQSVLLQRSLFEKTSDALSIRELKDKYKNKIIFVLGSGRSLEYINKEFFKDKITIGCNKVYKSFPCSYSVMIHHDFAQEAINDGQKIITSRFHCAVKTSFQKLKGEHYYFNHKDNRHKNSVIQNLDQEDSILVGCSVSLSAIHIAYYLGAKTIFLCGMDCGSLDGETNIEGYPQPQKNQYETFNNFENQSIQIANLIRSKGVDVMSINPFVNFGLEGKEYKRF